jgi:hypothetical protein
LGFAPLRKRKLRDVLISERTLAEVAQIHGFDALSGLLVGVFPEAPKILRKRPIPVD